MTEEPFDLVVTYKAEEHTFNASLLVTGYTYKFRVLALGQVLLFEPDEEGSYRAIIEPADDDAHKTSIDKELLQAIIQKLESIRD